MIGQTISHYHILEKLGEGGMGVVYKAQDAKLNRTVALKFLPQHLSASEQDKARFIQEAQAAAALNHPNICTIHGIEEHDGQTFIVMEFIEGQTLRDKGANVPLKQTIEIGIQLAEGLAVAHEKGIVHRDLKPENIMLQKDGRVRVMDFGLAKLKGASRLTKAGSTVGTTGYMSPEQVQGLEIDHRTDIFSLGVILYELFAGQSPFKGVHETAINYEIVNVDPEPMLSVKPEISPELDAIVLECMAKEPSERSQSAAEVAKDLRRVKRESSKTRMSRVTTATSRVSSTPEQPARKVSFGLAKLLSALLSVVLVAAAVGAYVLFFAKPEQTFDSVAVMPLVNVGGDPNTDYLSDGITEAIINNLSRLRNLRVMSRSSVFRFKGQEIDPLEVGKVFRTYLKNSTCTFV
jgi:serine/threonine protein kinase